jgi:ribonucleotide monophosphatase NagD (HAD superfamily)
MKEISYKIKNNTIAIDFDGVIHKYSKGWQGLYNAYDPPMEGAVAAIKKLKSAGYRLVVFSSRAVPVIQEWLHKYDLDDCFEEVTNTKIPARVYIDDRAYHFDTWEKTMEDLFD